VWRVPPGGGEPKVWLTDPRLDGSEFGATGVALTADRRAFVIGMQSEGGGAAGDPSTGRLWMVPIAAGGRAGAMEQLWESRPLDGPDGFALARSGAIYVALLPVNQIAVVGPDGSERERFPQQPGTGENGSSVPFDSPSSAHFLGTRLIVAQQSYFAGDPTHWAILDVEAAEPGLPELIPPGAGVRDAVAPRLSHIRLDGRRLRLRLSERASLRVRAVSRSRHRVRRARLDARGLRPGRRSLRFRLRRGRWRVTLTARDAAGNRSRLRRRVRIR
jgi:hypothetical protein